MVYSLVVLSVLFFLGAAVFFALFVDAYRHLPAKVKVEVRHETHRR